MRQTIAPALGMGIADCFAANLRLLLTAQGLSVNGAAKLWKVPTKTLESILKRQRTPTLDTAEAIAKASGFELWQLTSPGFDPANPPVLRAISAAEADLYERLRAMSRGGMPNNHK